MMNIMDRYLSHLTIYIILIFVLENLQNVRSCSVQCNCNTTVINCDGASNLPETFQIANQSTIQKVILTNTGITTLTLDTFAYVPMLTEIDLSGNDILCNDDILWLKTWLSMGGHTLTGSCVGGTNLVTYLNTNSAAGPVVNSLHFNTEYNLHQANGNQNIRVTRNNDAVTGTKLRIETVLMSGSEADFVIEKVYWDVDTPSFNIPLAFPDNDNGDSETTFLLKLVPEDVITVGAEATVTVSSSSDGDDYDSENSESIFPPDNNNIDEENKDYVLENSESSFPPDTDSEPDDHKNEGSKAWIIVVVIVIIILVVVAAALVVMKLKSRKRTAADAPVSYSAVKGGSSDSKVYNATTEELA